MVNAEGLHGWLRERQYEDAAPIYHLEAPATTWARLEAGRFNDIDVIRSVRVESGTTELVLTRTPPDGRFTALDLARSTVELLDPDREMHRWPGPDKEEAGGRAGFSRTLVDEEMTTIGGIRPVGPGGRVRVSRWAEQWTVDVSVRGRDDAVQSYWRDPTVVASGALAALREAPPDTRLRVAFGYYEASKYERQEWLRTAFVFLLDRHAVNEGPRWRVAIVERATDSDDLPPGAGLGHEAGNCI
jgi:hypothetical protein